MTDWYAYPVTHPYIDHYESNVDDTPHFAVDIGTDWHTQITALLPGTVEKADFQAWGGELFIKPDDSHFPEYYYYHLDDLAAGIAPGTHVNAGQLIGLSGGQTSGGDHPVTDGESTGPHTHVGYFTNYATPPETGFTIPYGPDITPLIDAAVHNGIGNGGASPPPAGGTTDPYPGGSLNPMNWPSEAQKSVNNASATIAADIVNWINTSIGPFLMRVGVGVVGIGLIYLGSRELLDALKNVPAGYQKSRGSSQRAKSQPTKKKPAEKPKTPEKKTIEKTKPKEEKKPEKEEKKAEKAVKTEKKAETAEKVVEAAAV